ncbi:Diphthamide biosynthesis protein 2 [Desmophyllum pertusum]|uniref:Diphthamide biosynthesis protein 2 n=1 Tax=Desmophyllum pertusum TaxID=174260 RepID=A0A9X0CC17_9CNID|nr:Diphthamide biosynthesis protein 2 [Desmophyllum pertusum]
MADAACTSVLQFSGGEKEVIERKLHVSTDALDTRKNSNDFYEISRCVDVIKSRGFQKIALQFPDSLLVDSAAVASLVEKNTGKKVFVLADTSYGSCCVDEVCSGACSGGSHHSLWQSLFEPDAETSSVTYIWQMANHHSELPQAV